MVLSLSSTDNDSVVRFVIGTVLFGIAPQSRAGKRSARYVTTDDVLDSA